MRHALVLTLALGTLGLVAGCTIPENPAAVSARTVCAAAYGDGALDPIRGRIPLGDQDASKASMSQLADGSKPGDAERAALHAYDSANRRCWDAWDKVGTSAYVQQARTNVSAALAELVTGRVTFGDFNRRRAQAVAEMNARLREEAERQRAAVRTGMMFCDGWGRGPFTTLHCF